MVDGATEAKKRWNGMRGDRETERHEEYERETVGLGKIGLTVKSVSVYERCTSGGGRKENEWIMIRSCYVLGGV